MVTNNIIIKKNQYKKNQGFLLVKNHFNLEHMKMMNSIIKNKNKEKKNKDYKEKKNFKKDKLRYGQKNQ
jgi:hypothetical protein